MRARAALQQTFPKHRHSRAGDGFCLWEALRILEEYEPPALPRVGILSSGRHGLYAYRSAARHPISPI